MVFRMLLVAAGVALASSTRAISLRDAPTGPHRGPRCASWCETSTRSWTELCDKDGCATCTPCSTTATTTPASNCKSWCDTSTKSWEKLCKKKNCEGCNECTAVACQDWCHTSTRSWNFLCKANSCSQCSECKHLQCKSWCSTSTRSWDKLCKKENCKECPKCKEKDETPAATTTASALGLPTRTCNEPGGARTLPYRGNIGYEYEVDCVGCSLDTGVWGTGPFWDNSSICGAAYFLGLVRPSGEGLVVVTILPGCGFYEAGYNDRRCTSSHLPASLLPASLGGSFALRGSWIPTSFIPITTTPAKSLYSCMESGGVTAMAMRGFDGLEYQVDCTKCSVDSVVWGADPFTDDSSICGAAFFLGVIDSLGHGDVVVRIMPGEKVYPHATNDRRFTLSYGAWPGSFTIKH